VAREHQHGFRQSAGQTEGNVRGVIPDHGRLSRLKPEALPQAAPHARLGLAAAAAVLGRVRAVGHGFEGHAVGREQFGQPLLHGLEILQGVVAASDARLVGDHEQAEAPGGQPGQGLARAGHQLHQGRVVQVVLFHDDGAVAVDEHVSQARHGVLPGMPVRTFGVGEGVSVAKMDFKGAPLVWDAPRQL